MKFALPLALALGIAGCSQSKGNDELSCPAVAEKVVEIIKSELGKLPEAQRSALGAQLATIRSEVIEDCKKDPAFFEAKSACIMKATSTADLEGCEKTAPKPAAEPAPE